MDLWDFDGRYQVDQEKDLQKRLHSTRRGVDAAFILSHDCDETLWLHFHGDAAFLWFLPHNDGKHPGFVPAGMGSGAEEDVRFLQTNGLLADSIVVPWRQLVPPDVAYQAAVEYLHHRGKPTSITWCKL
jgi:hypothetical protein